MSTVSQIQPALFRLPLELRQQIYNHLLPASPISHPLPSVGITSVSHHPPTLNTLLIHPLITSEVLNYFYTLASFKLIFSHAFNFFRTDADLTGLERSPILSRIRKVEVVFFCDILLLKDYPSFGLHNFCAEIKRRADRACDVLAQAEELRVVKVSWIDTTLTGGWEAKAAILEPLKKLSEMVTFRIGEINGPEELERQVFDDAMRKVLGHGGKLESGSAQDGDGEPSKLRMLAFDPRQERHLVPEKLEGRCCRGCRGTRA